MKSVYEPALSEEAIDSLRVHKFGGTSVDSAGQLRAMARIVRDQGVPAVVVASAMAGVTDELSGLADEPELLLESHKQFEVLETLRLRHHEILREIVDQDEQREAIGTRINLILDKVSALLDGPTDGNSARLRDQMMAAGEDLVVELAAAALQAEGIAASVLNAREVVWTDARFGSALPDIAAIRRLAPERVGPLLDKGLTPVIQGFIGSEADGATTTLGRGGSDFTAALLGSALGASEVVIWTDVDGIHSGDPDLVGEAVTLSDVGFEEAVELAYFGARIIHPAAAKHAIAHNVLLRIKNTFSPEHPGTLIHFDRRETATFRAVAHKNNVILIRVKAFPTTMAYGFLARVFEVLAQHKVPVDLVATSHSSTAFTIDRDKELAKVQLELSEFAEVVVVEDLSTVTVVGSGLLREPRIDALAFWAAEKTPVYLISQASDVSISFVVDEAEAPELVRRLHLSLIELRQDGESRALRSHS